MKAILLSLALALLMAGCSEESRSVGHDGYVEDKTFLSSLHSLKNKRTEFDRIKRLAKGGDKSAQDNLGVMYSIGDGVPQDYKEAAKWFTKAAEQGYANAQYSLGVMYSIGDGVPQDYKEAVKWFTKAAEQGDADAQKNLGVMYDTGEGVPQDYKEAVKWYTKAAEQGDADAQNNLGVMFDNGEGVPKDLVQAYAWYNVANAYGQEKAKECRDKIELTPRQLAEAQSLSTEIYKRIEGNRQD